MGSGGRLEAVLVVLFPLRGVLASPALAAKPAKKSPVVPASSAWKRYVIDPGQFVYPKNVYVVGSKGSVTNPTGLEAPGGDATTLTTSTTASDGAPALIIDLGGNCGGYAALALRSSNGTPIRLGYSEMLGYLTPLGDNLGGAVSFGVSDDPEGRSDVLQTTAPISWRSPGIRGAQRYISIDLQGAGSVSIDYIRVETEHLRPGTSQYSGYFLSNDRLLNEIWYASAYTFAMDSFRDVRIGPAASKTVVTDGAKRDRMVWAGDLAMENLVGNYSLRAARGIVGRSLQVFSCLQFSDGQLSPGAQIVVQCPRDPPPPVHDAASFPATTQPAAGYGALRLPLYTAEWIIAVNNYYMLTGDRKFAHLMMPVIRRGLDYFLGSLDGGLYRTPSDPATINWHPPDLAGGIDTYTNATLFQALLSAATLERSVGLGRRAATADLRRAGALRTAILARLWDPGAGAFIGNTDDPTR